MKYEQIKPYIEKGLITERPHPEAYHIKIFNYSPACQYSGAWDDITMQCRGLIMDTNTGEILARPFKKFFNYQELLSKGVEIPDEPAVVSEKMDGSLGILVNINGRPCIATRGSFMSEQAIWATDWWRKTIGDEPWGEPGITYLFEIIYDGNRIVVDYDFEGLVHLASIDTTTGKTLPSVPHGIRQTGVMEINTKEDLEMLSAMDKPNSEGFVVYFPKADMRMKIKFPEYVRLHKIVTGLSEIGIWEAMRDGKINGLIKEVPDEFYKWFEDVRDRIQDEYTAIELQAEHDFNGLFLVPNSTRAEKASYITKCKNPGILFSMLDEKDYSQAIWKMVRPSGQKTYKVDNDQ